VSHISFAYSEEPRSILPMKLVATKRRARDAALRNTSEGRTDGCRFGENWAPMRPQRARSLFTIRTTCICALRDENLYEKRARGGMVRVSSFQAPCCTLCCPGLTLDIWRSRRVWEYASISGRP